MDVKVVKDIKSKVLGIFLPEGRDKLPEGIPSKLKKRINELKRLESFKGKESQVVKLQTLEGGVDVVYLVGLGKRSAVNEDTYRRAGANLIKRLKKDKVSSADVLLTEDRRVKELSKVLTEGLILGNYSFEKYKTSKDNGEGRFEVKRVNIVGGDKKEVEKGKVLAEAQLYARGLVNEPGNVINPITLAEEAKKLAEEYGLECKVYDEKEIQDMGMLALWNVGKGSATPPRFIHITYKPKGKAKDRIAIVGKGLTFDSGGLNIKTGNFMRTMKMDKSGACAVLGIMRAIAQLKPKVEVHGIIGAAENMPSGSAYRPDDIIRAKNGKTIEVDNTDAEGRITLADALSYASELKPSKIIDMATLTGACMVALGEYTAGLFTNDEKFAKELKSIAGRTGERVWELPMDDERLRKHIKNTFADVLNTGGRYGGAITAAMFLQEFVGDGIKWIHLDIAGPAWSKEDYAYYSKGGTGFGVRTCVEYILSI